jgi:hypothetical protein
MEPIHNIELRESALLAEYQAAHEHAHKFDNAIWQTASVFIPVSLAGLIFIPQAGAYSPSRFFTIVAIALGSIIMLSGWVAMIYRWDAYKRVVFIRLREIEKELGLWHNRYLQHMYVTRIQMTTDVEIQTEEEKLRFEKLDSAFTRFPGISSSVLLRRVAIGIMCTWIALVIVEFMFTF